MIKINAIVKFGGVVLGNLLSYSVVLAEGSGASSCSLVFSDGGDLVNSLVKHTLTNGGIRNLPEDQAEAATAPRSAGINSVDVSKFVVKDKQPYAEKAYGFVGVSPYGAVFNKGTQRDKEVAVFLEAVRQGITQPHHFAFILAVFKGETHWRDVVNNTDAGARVDGGKYKGRGLAQITFKYNYERVAAVTGVTSLVDNPELIRQNAGINLAGSVSSIKTGTTGGKSVNKGLSKWIPSPNSDRKTAYRRIQGGVWRNAYEKYYQEYSLKLPEISNAAKAITGESKAPIPTEADSSKITPTTTTKKVSLVDNGSAIPKGSKITVDILGSTFSYWHTGTQYDASKKETTLTGQGLRWVLNRKERNSTEKGITLKELAVKITSAAKLKLKYNAKLNPKYSLIQQQQITDFALLKKEVSNAGLFITEKGDTVTISDIPAAVAEGVRMTITPEICINLSVEDKALDAADVIPDKASSFAQFEQKMAIDIASGKMVPVTAEVVGKQGSPANPGKATEDTSKVDEKDKVAVKQNQSRYKRINGLPSTMTLPFSEETLTLEPIQVIETKGFGTELDRVWLIHSVSHGSDGITTLDITSPINIVDTTPVSLNKGILAETDKTSNNILSTVELGKWVYPSAVRRRVTSEFGRRSRPGGRGSRNHGGIDIGNFTGDSILAANSGVVSFTGPLGGYGNLIKISHSKPGERTKIETRYAHLSRILVSTGQVVKSGEVIAKSGGAKGAVGAGTSTGPHLHFEYRVNGQATNPRQLPISY